jgi:hypothetical protein
MKTKILLPVVMVAAIAALMFCYSQMGKVQTADKEEDQPIAAASRVQSGANGETVITLDTRAQQLIGLQTATLAAATVPPEVKAWGRVLDSATLVSLHNDVVAAQAALQASKPEYERLKKLSTEDNASAHSLQTAEAQMKHDQGAFATAKAQLLAASGEAVLDEPAEFFQSLAKQESVLVRLDVPAGEAPAEAPTGAQLKLPGTSPPVAADFLGRAAVTDPQVQGAGFILVVTNAPAAPTPGLSVTGFLQLPGEPVSGVIVPDAAVVRSDGRAWIYVQTGDTTFARREIFLSNSAAGGWFVTNNVAPGDRIVVTGAQTLLSEERKSQIKLED